MSTGETIEAAIQVLLTAGCAAGPIVAVSHGIFASHATERLQALSVRRVLTTDSVEQPNHRELPLACVSLAPFLAEAIRRLNANESIAALIHDAN